MSNKNDVVVTSVNHVEGTSYYINDTLIFDLPQGTKGPGVIEYQVKLDMFLKELNTGLNEFGFKIVPND